MDMIYTVYTYVLYSGIQIRFYNLKNLNLRRNLARCSIPETRREAYTYRDNALNSMLSIDFVLGISNASGSVGPDTIL
jgi:hypothetical protein